MAVSLLFFDSVQVSVNVARAERSLFHFGHVGRVGCVGWTAVAPV